MTARTWIGGKSNNQVTDPSNFSPMGAPEPGDNLTITSGTMISQAGNCRRRMF